MEKEEEKISGTVIGNYYRVKIFQFFLIRFF